MIVYTADCWKNLQIENWSSFCQRWSLHCFQTSHFICDQFGCKLWLVSIQNHSWHHFSKLLRTAIWSCFAVLFESEQTPFPQAGSQFRPAALHRIWFRRCSFVTLVPISYFRDVVQPPVFVTVALKRKQSKLLSPGHVSACQSRQYITRQNTKFVLCQIHKCRCQAHDSIMDSCFLPMQPPFFLVL